MKKVIFTLYEEETIYPSNIRTDQFICCKSKGHDPTPGILIPQTYLYESKIDPVDLDNKVYKLYSLDNDLAKGNGWGTHRPAQCLNYYFDEYKDWDWYVFDTLEQVFKFASNK